jgi:signal transduction histidine kinase
MTQRAPAGESLLELYEALAQRQLRDAGAEIASAIAHAVGTPLNVISGRAELIRHDPSNALAQVARIEEQVKKLATGLRQIVDYLAVPEAPAGASGAGSPRPGGAPATGPALPLEIVDAQAVLRDAAALAEPVSRALGVDVAVDGERLTGGRVERWHSLGTLSSLVSAALREAAPRQSASGSSQRDDGDRIGIGGSLGPQGVTFELRVPGLAAVQGWQLEHFHARPASAEGTEFHRTMSICATIVRGHGGRLLAEASPDGRALIVRFSCRNEADGPGRA